MDILSARKKAAERARARKKAEAESPAAAQPAAAAPAPPLPEPAPQPSPAKAEPTTAGVNAAPAPEAALPAAAPQEEQEPEEVQAHEIEMLSFRLSGEEYAVMVDHVKEVLKNRDMTPVPNAPDYVLGVTGLRGEVLPVIDLCKRLGLPAGTRDDKSRIIVVSLNEEEAGIVVDRVTGVIRIADDAIRPTPETIEHGAEFLRGIVRKDDRLYILLDIEKAVGA